MPALLDLPRPSAPAESLPAEGDLATERALLESLARTAERPAFRLQALVELMALEAAAGNEVAFTRIRHELAQSSLPAPVATLYQARTAWGLARFGRYSAASRCARGALLDADTAQVREWLLELDRELDSSAR
jgi:hypothetical protein